METPTFIQYMVDEIQNWTASERERLVQMLKENPETLKNVVINRMDEWAVRYCTKFPGIRMVIIDNLDTTADEIISGWRDVSKEDLKKASQS